MGKARSTSDDQSSETEEEQEDQSISQHDQWRSKDSFAQRNGAPRPPR